VISAAEMHDFTCFNE